MNVRQKPSSRIHKHGPVPYRAAVLHGGPGAPGSAAVLARELSGICGVLEPWQTGNTISELLDELRRDLTSCGHPPVILVGHSWGAWLGWIFAAHHPELVSKLVLVGSGPFEQHYADDLMARRLARLSAKEQAEARSLMAALGAGGCAAAPPAAEVLSRFGRLMSKADAYDLLEATQLDAGCNLQQHLALWAEGEGLRRSGELLALGASIECPVVAVQGDHDPHGCDGVRIPLGRVLRDFRFIGLDRCGHSPWLERWARDAFVDVMRRELIA